MAERTGVGSLVDHDVEATPSATVVLLRDSRDGPEVFLLERHLDSDFAGGAYVFPGGKVDAADHGLDPARYIPPDDLDALTVATGAADGDDCVALHVATVREAFEEAGSLLARRASGAPVTAADLASASFNTARDRLNDRDEGWDWRAWLADEDLVLDLPALAFLAWWVTPAGVHRRFDTRFFVAEMPMHQRGALGHDDVETTASLWIRPGEALRQAEAGEASIVYPTRKVLAVVAGFATVEEVLTAARAGRTDRRRLQPTIVVGDDDVAMIQHPDGGPPERG